MKNILVLGAGKSATCLIDYLAAEARVHQWLLTVADGNIKLAETKVSPHGAVARAEQLDVTDREKRNALIEKADIVVSLLPPALHYLVAENCITAGKNLLTASYIDDAIRRLEPQVKAKQLLFLCEMGLDPGIDHMSAMQLINRVQKENGEIDSFYSHCGGLVAPESDDNPWHYKISWNPRNVVMAGKAGAIYRLNGKTEQMAYENLFNSNRTITVADNGHFAWYPNRDSLPYIDLYGLQQCASFVRTTLRHPAFCKGWKMIVDLGLTDDRTRFNTDQLSFIDFLNWHRQLHPLLKEEDEAEKQMFDFLELYSQQKIAKGQQTAADILQAQMEKKWLLQPHDKDMVIMKHEIGYTLNGLSKKLDSWLVVKGENNVDTAMAKTVGLPLGIATSLLLKKQITLTGLQVPVLPAIYEPVLKLLAKEGIAFTEHTY